MVSEVRFFGVVILVAPAAAGSEESALNFFLLDHPAVVLSKK